MQRMRRSIVLVLDRQSKNRKQRIKSETLISCLDFRMFGRVVISQELLNETRIYIYIIN